MHSDSIMLLRTDPSHHRLYYLSIPRDLQVPIPGAGTQKINAAFQIGGPALAIRTIRQFTGLEVNHVMVDQLRRLQGSDRRARRDRRERAEADPLEPVRLPVRHAGAVRPWPGWRFQKGDQHMSGERALIYSRIRENMLDPAETDVTRGARQQAVLNAVARSSRRSATLMQMPFSGGSFAKPLTTDLTAAQLVAARLGEVPRLELRLGPLPARRRPRRQRHRQPERGQPGDDRDVPRTLGPPASHRSVRARLRDGACAQVAAAARLTFRLLFFPAPTCHP